MRLKRDNSNLPIDEQVKKLKLKIKYSLIFGFIWNACVIVLALILIILTPLWDFGVGCLITVPMSLGLGGILQTKVYKEKIKKLEEQKVEIELQEKLNR